MADTPFKSFVIGLGFQLDQAGMARLEAFARNSEAWAKQMTASVDELAKTIGKSTQEMGKSTTAVEKHQAAHHKMREAWEISKTAVLGFVGALTTLAVTGEEAVRRVSREMTNLFYLSQQTGVAAKTLESVTFALEKIGISSDRSKQAISSLASAMQSSPGLAQSIQNLIGRPFTDAADAMDGAAKKYAEVVRIYGEGSASVAALRNQLKALNVDPDYVKQHSQGLDNYNKALARGAELLERMGLGGKHLDDLIEKSRKFDSVWQDFGFVIDKVWKGFAGSLMPGATRLLNIFINSIGNVEHGFEDLEHSIKQFLDDLIGAEGKEGEAWLRNLWTEAGKLARSLKDIPWKEIGRDIGVVAEFAATLFHWLAAINDVLGPIPTLLLLAFGPAAAKGLIGGFFSAIATQFVGFAATSATAGATAGAAFSLGFAGAATGIIGAALASLFAGWELWNQSQGKPGTFTDPNNPDRFGDPSIPAMPGGAGAPPTPFPNTPPPVKPPDTHTTTPATPTPAGSAAKEPPPVVPPAAPHPVAAEGQDRFTTTIEKLSANFAQWWSGSASFNPIVQLTQDFYLRMDVLLHQLLEDFGFERKKKSGAPGGGGGAGAGAGGGGGGGGTGASPGGGGGAPAPGGEPSPGGGAAPLSGPVPEASEVTQRLNKYTAGGNARIGGASSITGVHPEFQERVDRMLAAMPEELRKDFVINSGYRDAARQAQVHGSVKNSYHTGTGPAGTGMAMDISMNSPGRQRVWDWISKHPEYGVGFPLAGKIAGEEHHMEPLEGGQRIGDRAAWLAKYDAARRERATAGGSGTTAAPGTAPSASAAAPAGEPGGFGSAKINFPAGWQPDPAAPSMADARQEFTNPQRKNPGNLRVDPKNDWVGKVTQPGDAFESFNTVAAGIRARAITYSTYIQRGVNTIANIAKTSGPAEDKNDIPTQIAAYKKALGGKYAQPGGEDLPIESTPENLRRLTRGGISIEVGGKGEWLPKGAATKEIDEAFRAMMPNASRATATAAAPAPIRPTQVSATTTARPAPAPTPARPAPPAPSPTDDPEKRRWLERLRRPEGETAPTAAAPPTPPTPAAAAPTPATPTPRPTPAAAKVPELGPPPDPSQIRWRTRKEIENDVEPGEGKGRGHPKERQSMLLNDIQEKLEGLRTKLTVTAAEIDLGRHLGAERRRGRGRDTGGDYGGGGDKEVVHKSETTINVVGAADPHGTARATRDLVDRSSAMEQRGKRRSLA